MKFLGLIVLLIWLVNTLIAIFAYRDFSIHLVIMFLISSVGYPLALILLSRKNFKYQESDNQEIEVKGLFTISNTN
mgnify:CR=1 FL=1